MFNNTIADNRCAGWGGGVYSATFSFPEVKNTIIYGNTAGNYQSIFVSGDDSITVTYSDVSGGWEGEGNIDAAPLFASPASGDYSLTWANFPAHDSTRSPCIDAGDPDSACFDPDQTRGDIGAFYFHQFLPDIRDLTITIADSIVTLRWGAVYGAAEYLVFESEAPHFPPGPAHIMTISAPDTSAMLGAVPEGMKFYLIISRR